MTLSVVPPEFVLFGLTLLGVALFHRHTLPIAAVGLAAIVLYKITGPGFADGPGLNGLAGHFRHEWAILANLLCLLLGFALSRGISKRAAYPCCFRGFCPMTGRARCPCWRWCSSCRAFSTTSPRP